MASKPDHVARYIARVAAKGELSTLLQGGTEAVGETETREAARTGLREIERGRTPSPGQTAGLEAIILPKIRPVLDVIDGDFRTDHPLWLKLNDDQRIRGSLLRAIPSIGRIELPGNADYPYGGTGFVVGERLVMTNRHVAAIFADGLGTRRLAFKPGLRAGIDFRRELDRPTGPTIAVRRVVMVHPYWDVALLEIDGLPDTVKPLALSQRDTTSADMFEVAAIGYPAFDTRNDGTVQNDLFRSVFGVKRLQPGTLGGRQETESFGKMVAAARHNCSTLGGNSGSALIDLDSGEVVALHFGGRFRMINYAVPGSELAKDGRVVDAGVSFAKKPAGGVPPWAQWWIRADEETVTSDPIAAPATDNGSSPGSPQTKAQAMSDGSIQIVVPLHVTLRLGCPGQDVGVVDGAVMQREDTIEALVMPFHDENYESRTGYDPGFLGASIPMPRATMPADVARTKDGSDVLHYQNFSIVMHAKRRMALCTASNVTADPRLKKPEPGRSYTRKGLSGLGDKDQERWFPDPRLDDAFQLPDAFYTRDDGAFDKGHIVRREDVAWGKTYKLLRMANGDSYHVTNCSPQVAGFNRSTLGEDNWGDLEDHVLKGAADERYCQFAGPILDPNDEVFLGRAGGRNRVKVKIPSRYWKVIVVKTENGVNSYGFVLEQDLSDVTFEEFVPAQFKRFMMPLTDLQDLTGVTFPAIVLNADQHDTDEGIELAFHAGVKRVSSPAADREGVIV